MKNKGLILLALSVTTFGLVSSGLIFNVKPNEVHQKQHDIPQRKLELPPGVVGVSNYGELRSTLATYSDAGTLNIMLTADCIADASEDRAVAKFYNFNIDLNGHKIGRASTAELKNDGHVLDIRGGANVSITDSEGMGNGEIYGGYAYHGGTIYVTDQSTLYLNGITVRNGKAFVDGGGIYLDGHLEAHNVTIKDCVSQSWGGGISVGGGGSFALYNSTIDNNRSNDDGAGIEVHDAGLQDLDLLIDGCTISNNKIAPTRGEGAGICVNNDERTFTLKDSTIENNSGAVTGGGLYIGGYRNDECLIDDCTFIGNSAIHGGGMATDGDVTIVSDGDEDVTTFTKNKAEHAGGISADGDILTINECNVLANSATESGGGMMTRGGEIFVNDITMKYNSAKYGSAIEVGMDSYYSGSGDSRLYLYGGLITENSASEEGAVRTNENNWNFFIHGSPKIYNNYAPNRPDILLCDNKLLTVDGNLGNDANLYVSLENDAFGQFANNFRGEGGDEYNQEIYPDDVFHNYKGQIPYLSDETNASLKEKGTYPKALVLEYQNAPADFRSLKGSNWMSGIPGSRKLHEINIPGTHDSSMRKTESHWTNSIGGALSFDENAVTQRRYIDELLDEGARILDIRVNSTHEVKHKFLGVVPYYTEERNLPELYICHGKTYIGGTFWALDRQGHDLTLTQVLNWVKAFLIKNPSETVICEFAAEHRSNLVVGDETEIILNTLYGRLKDFSTEINPSTQKPFLYMEKGIFGNPYSDYPELDDARGQIFLIAPEERFGGMSGGNYEFGSVNTSYSPSLGYDCQVDEKIEDTKAFINDRKINTNEAVMIPEPGKHLDIMYKMGFNVVPTIASVPTATPLECADEVNPKFFSENSPNSFGQYSGKYLGWLRLDGGTASEFRTIWQTNYPNNELQVRNVTVVKDDTGENPEETQNLKVIRGTRLKLSNDIFEKSSSTGKYLVSYRDSGGHRYYPGYNYIVTDNVVFTCEWSDIKNPTLNVIWRDGRNFDNIRPYFFTVDYDKSDGNTETMYLTYYYRGEYDLPGAPIRFDNTVIRPNQALTGKDNEHPFGIDGAGKYRYTLEADYENQEFTLTMIHTPVDSGRGDLEVDVKPLIEWNDFDNESGRRPESVEATIMKNGEAYAAYTLNAANNWTHDFGTFTRFIDGEEDVYTLELPEIDGYELVTRGFHATYVLQKEVMVMGGVIIWSEDTSSPSYDPANRPTELNILLYNNGEYTSRGAVVTAPTEDAEGKPIQNNAPYWHFSINLLDYPHDEDAYNFSLDLSYGTKQALASAGYIYEIEYVGQGSDRNFVINVVGEGMFLPYQQVMHDINDIGLKQDIEDTEYYREKIALARNGYDALSEDEKQFVTNYDEFLEKEAMYVMELMLHADRNMGADAASYDRILYARAAYNNLCDEARALISSAITDYLDNIEVNYVRNVIADLSGDNSANTTYEEKLEIAAQLYNDLTDSQRSSLHQTGHDRAFQVVKDAYEAAKEWAYSFLSVDCASNVEDWWMKWKESISSKTVPDSTVRQQVYNYLGHADYDKEDIAGATIISRALERYDLIMKRYHDSDPYMVDFLGRIGYGKIDMTPANSFKEINEIDDNAAFVVMPIVIAACIGIGAAVIIRKRKSN